MFSSPSQRYRKIRHIY